MPTPGEYQNGQVFTADDANWMRSSILTLDGKTQNATAITAGLMSAADKSKLDGIASGAEVNVQADWAQTSTSADDFIKNKPGNATSSVDGLMSAEDKAKLDSLVDDTLTVTGKAADAKVTGDIRDAILITNTIDIVFRQGAISSGADSSSNTAIRLRTPNYYEARYGFTLEVTEGFRAYIYYYERGESGYTYKVSSGEWVSGTYTNDSPPYPYMRFMLSKTDGDEKLLVTDVVPPVTIDAASVTDKKLEVLGKAADAKIAGDSIRFLQSEVAQIGYCEPITITPFTGTVGINGATAEYSNGSVKLYGTISAVRRFCCLNGQKFVATSATAMRTTLMPGVYKVTISTSGSWPSGVEPRIATTPSTYNAGPVKYYADGAQFEISESVMAGINVAASSNFGTEESPSYIYIRIDRLERKAKFENVESLKNLAENTALKEIPNTSTWEIGGFSSVDGTETETSVQIRTVGYIDASEIIGARTISGYKIAIFAWSKDSGNYVGRINHLGEISGDGYVQRFYEWEFDPQYKYRLTMINNSAADITTSAASNCRYLVRRIDNTLSAPQEAADAKATGDAISGAVASIDNVRETLSDEIDNVHASLDEAVANLTGSATTVSGLYISATGTLVALSSSSVDRTICVHGEPNKTYRVVKATSTVMRAGCGASGSLAAGDPLVGVVELPSASTNPLRVTTDEDNTWIYVQLFTDSAGSTTIDEHLPTLVVCEDVHYEADMLKHQSKAVSTLVNSLHNLVNYGYDSYVNKTTSYGVTVERNGTRVLLNGSASSSSYGIRFVISGDNVPTFTSQTISNGLIKLTGGHKYRYRLRLVSGTVSRSVSPWIVKAGAVGTSDTQNISTDPITGDTLNEFVYSDEAYPDGIFIIIYAPRSSTGITFTGALFEATLEDVTSGCADDAFSNVAPLEAETATSVHHSGDLVVYNRKLYEVISDISVGDALTPGTNVAETTIEGKLVEASQATQEVSQATQAAQSDADALEDQLDPEMMITSTLYIQNGTYYNDTYKKTVMITNGLISASVTSNSSNYDYTHYYITGEFATQKANLSSGLPPIGSVLPISKLSGLNAIKAYVDSTVTYDVAAQLVLYFCSVSEDTVTRLGNVVVKVTSTNGEKKFVTTKFTIPEGTTHYALDFYTGDASYVANKRMVTRVKFCYLPTTT